VLVPLVVRRQAARENPENMRVFVRSGGES
jgi:hypothetical protein